MFSSYQRQKSLFQQRLICCLQTLWILSPSNVLSFSKGLTQVCSLVACSRDKAWKILLVIPGEKEIAHCWATASFAHSISKTAVNLNILTTVCGNLSSLSKDLNFMFVCWSLINTSLPEWVKLIGKQPQYLIQIIYSFYCTLIVQRGEIICSNICQLCSLQGLTSL